MPGTALIADDAHAAYSEIERIAKAALRPMVKPLLPDLLPGAPALICRRMCWLPA